MKDMKLSTKIGLGFGFLILIALALGTLAVWNMSGVKAQSTRLQEAYVPEALVGNNIERWSLLTMYDLRGYGYTEEDRFLKGGREALAKLNGYLADAKVLAEEQDLEKLKGLQAEAAAGVDEYEKLIEETVALNASLDSGRKQMDVFAARYMSTCADFLRGQEEKLQRDLVERRERIDTVAAIAAAGTSARVDNFKAQATGDAALIEEVVSDLGLMAEDLEAFLATATDPATIKVTKEAIAATEGYREAVKGFDSEFEKGTAAQEQVLDKWRTEMDRNAAAFVTSTNALVEQQQARLQERVQERVLKIKLVNEIIDLGNAARINNFKSQALRDPDIMQEAIAVFPEVDKKFAELRIVTRDTEDIERINNTKASGDAYKNAMEGFLANWNQLQDVNRQRTVVGEGVLAKAQETASIAMGEVEDIAGSARASLGVASTVMIIGLIAAVVLGVITAFFITVGITKAIKAIILGLTEASEQVASASGQVSTSSQSLAEGASEQAAGIEETSSSLEELSSMTHQNAQNAGQANEIMTETSRVVDDANSSMGELTSQMKEISDASEETQKIIKTIDEIAFQTNLLALNAAVEAARAGEAGAGFAVVADEVRNLAMRAAEAAKNTSSLIEGSVTKITNGTQLVQKTNEAFVRVEGSARKAGELVNEIASASKEQSTGLDQINKAVAEMDKVTQQNASGAEESASAAEEMSAQAEQLRDYVTQLIAMVDGVHAAQDRRAGTGSAPRASHGHSPNQPRNKTGPVTKPKSASPSPGSSGNGSGFYVREDAPSGESIPMPADRQSSGSASRGKGDDLDFTDEH